MFPSHVSTKIANCLSGYNLAFNTKQFPGVIPLDLFLDIALLVFHCGLIAFNCLGMLWRRTRFANLVTLLLTGASWTLLGIWYGLGYCPLTDWHWQVKTRLGVTGLPNSYLKWLVDAPTGWDVNAVAVDWVAGVVFASSLALSLWLNLRDFKAQFTPSTGST